jgi:heme d1 biosynthesis radical SAM protein NirJ
MLRLSRAFHALLDAAPPRTGAGSSGPVVIWNLIRRCNLACLHCYSISADIDFPGELGTEDVMRVMDDLKAFGVPALILSGGEPLLRKDIFEIAGRAKALGFYTALSTNGTLIDAPLARRIGATGFDYVGISLDGIEATHDRFRRQQGAFARSLAALRLCRDLDIKVGVRFTLTQDNAADLPRLLDLVEAERIDRFYLSHLNYAGRGNVNRKRDAHFQVTREALDLLFARAWDAARRGVLKDFVTGNNDADAAYLLMWARRHLPGLDEPRLRAVLAAWGGNSSGVNVANIDNLGNVHPDTMWWDCTLGNVRSRPFSAIWRDTRHPIMAGLKERPRRVKGRCAGCAYFDVCGGNTRVRAMKVTGDPWAEDPGCYLDDGEIAREEVAA